MDLVAPIKQLLSMSGFALRVATKHELAESHKSLIHNHKGGKAYETHVDLASIKEGLGHETKKMMLWN